MTAPDPRLLERIRKLRALAGSDNEHEAALAGARAAELLAEHQIAEADLGGGQLEVVDEGISDARGPKAVDWEAVLAVGISKGTGVRVYYERRGVRRVTGGQWKAIGTPDAVATARYMFQALSREIRTLSDRAWSATFPERTCTGGTAGVQWRPPGGPCDYDGPNPLRCRACHRPRPVRPDPRPWKATWRMGCAARISQRLRAARAAVVDRARASANSAAGTALVRLDQTEAAIAAFAERYQFVQQPPPKLDDEHRDALVLGSLAGDGVHLGGGPGLPEPAKQIPKPRP